MIHDPARVSAGDADHPDPGHWCASCGDVELTDDERRNRARLAGIEPETGARSAGDERGRTCGRCGVVFYSLARRCPRCGAVGS